ncbi:MAG: ATP-binding protein [Sphaerochaeta sp.]
MIAYVVSQRNYLFPEKIQIALYADRLEITAPGMVYDDLAIEKIKKGISRPRNPALTNAFIYMGLIRKWGSGIPKLFDLVKEYNLPEPLLESLNFSLRVNLFRKLSP